MNMYGRILYYGDWLKHITGTDKWQEWKVVGEWVGEELQRRHAYCEIKGERGPPPPTPTCAVHRPVERLARSDDKMKPFLFPNCLTRRRIRIKIYYRRNLTRASPTSALLHTPTQCCGNAPQLQLLTLSPYSPYLLFASRVRQLARGF